MEESLSPDVPIPVESPARFTLPKTVYVYLALLLLSYLLPPLLHGALPAVANRHRHATPEGELTEQDFNRYLTAETSTRMALSADAPGKVGAGKTKPADSGSILTTAFASRRDTSLKEAVDSYRALSKSTHSPNMDRRVLILTHALGKPLDETYLTTGLVPNLRLAGATDAEIAAETRLWHFMYPRATVGKGATTAPPPLATLTAAAEVAAGANRIEGMHLRFLQDRALADFYAAVHLPQEQAQAEQRLHAVAEHSVVAQTSQVLILFLAGLIGFGLLILFLVAAASRQWQIVGRVATAPLRLSWGELIDSFLFYIAGYRFLSLIIGLLISATGWQPDVHQMLILDASLQIGVGALAVGYVLVKARKHDTTLADIGLTTRRSVFADIGYGILGYCATLPILVIMGLLSKLIFRHSTSTTPNPVLPLMVGTHDPLSRALIFLMASVAAPLIEETFFRGVLFTGLRTRWGWTISALISAVCFALVHPVQDWLPIFAMGFTFATMREMRQSLIPGMTAHFLQNTLAFVMITSLFSS